jgi:glycosyltransferase involved in cell wall biosynthesis
LAQGEPGAGGLVHVVRAGSAQVSEHVISLTSLLNAWAYEVAVVGPLGKSLRTELGRAGVASAEVPLPDTASLGEQLSAARELGRLLRRRPVSLIHAHGFQAALSAVLARRGLKPAPPIVCTPHGLPFVSGESTPWRRRAYRWLLHRCDAVIAASDTQREQIGTLDPASARHVAVVPYGIDPRRYYDPVNVGRRRQLLGISPPAAVVGCVSEMAYGSPLELFLDAAALLSRRMPNVEFAVIGGGPDQHHFRDLAHRRGILGATVFLGEREELPQVLSALNVLAVPQRGWPAGMLALQALACGLRAVAIAGGEAEEMLPDTPEVAIVPSADPAALAEGIERQLVTESDSMRSPEKDEAAVPAELSSFLVSRQFYDLDRRWPAGHASAAGIGRARAPELLDLFSVQQMARNTVAVYHDLLDRRVGG